MIIAAIDPGKTGALVIYDPETQTVFPHNVPLKKIKSKPEPDWFEWAKTWGLALRESLPSLMLIEHVHAMPNQGVTSCFNFGKTYGFAISIAQTNCPYCPVHFVRPVLWKSYFGLCKTNKNDSRAKAREIFPHLSPHISRAKDDGVAEAALIAYYGAKNIEGILK